MKAWIAVSTLLLCGACSSTDKDLKPCPPKGIGVEDYNGVSAADQLAKALEYNCSEPQICPDLRGQAVGFGIDPNAAPGQIAFILTNCSNNAKLEITKVEVWGDSRCFFTNVTDADIQPGRSANPRETIGVKTDYFPTAVGEDHGQLRVYSNAQNFPVLKLPLAQPVHTRFALALPAVSSYWPGTHVAHAVQLGALSAVL